MNQDRPLRVLWVEPSLPVGGAERHVTTLLPSLDRARVQPSLVCIGESGALFHALTDGGVEAHALHRRKRQAVGSLADLVRMMRRIRPDIVCVRGYNAELLGRVAAVIARVPHTVVWVHNIGDVQPRGRIRKISDRVLAPATSGYFGVARAQIPYMVDELHYAPAKSRVIYNGVDPSRFFPSDDRSMLAGLGVAPDAPVVGIVAVLRPEKDHLTLLRAAAQVVSSIPDVTFLVIGDGELRSELEQAAERLGLGANVRFLGARSDVGDLLRALDVFVLCSYTVECFPVSLLEAMAAGRAAVCTAVGGIPELLVNGETGRLVPPRDPDMLAQRLVELLGDDDARHSMGAAARARVETKFSLRTMVESAELALEQVSGRRPRTLGRPIRLTLILDVTFVGGVEKVMLDVFRHFDPAVVMPRLVCLREPGPLAGEFRAAGFEVVSLDRTGRSDPTTLPKLVADLRRSATDAVLLAHHNRAALALGRFAARVARVPVSVLAPHDMDMAVLGKRCLPRWAVESMFLSDAMVLLSARHGAYLRDVEGVGSRPWRRVREYVVPNGIVVPALPGSADREWARHEFGADQDDFVIGIVARLSAQKAHQVLFAAIRSLLVSDPSTRLAVVGEGEREVELRSLAVELGIAERTSFLGIRDDVSRLLAGFDVSCLSSVHEAMPIAVIESMAAGLPVVATDCGCLSDMVTDGEHGFIVPIGDAEAMAQRLATLASDTELRARLGKSARAKAEREYRIEDTARGYERMLTQMLERT